MTTFKQEWAKTVKDIRAEFDRLHGQYELYHRASVQWKIQQQYDITHQEFNRIFDRWVDDRQQGR